MRRMGPPSGTSKATTSTAQLTTTSTSLAPNSSLASTTTISGENLALDLLLTIPIELETPAGRPGPVPPLVRC